MTVPPPHLAMDGDPNKSVNTVEYMDCRLRDIPMDVQRKLYKVERDLQGDTLGPIGEWTIRFNDKESALAAAKEFIRLAFTADWEMEEEDWCCPSL
jgi:hypothetical protein